MGEMMCSKETANTVTISTKEYKQLVEAQARINIFADYVNSEKYSVGKRECAVILGFELAPDQEES